MDNSSDEDGSAADLDAYKEDVKNLFRGSNSDESFPATTLTKEATSKLLRDVLFELHASCSARQFKCVKDLVVDVANMVKRQEGSDNAHGTVKHRFDILAEDVRELIQVAEDGENENDYDKNLDMAVALRDYLYLQEKAEVSSQFIYLLCRVICDSHQVPLPELDHIADFFPMELLLLKECD